MATIGEPSRAGRLLLLDLKQTNKRRGKFSKLGASSMLSQIKVKFNNYHHQWDDKEGARGEGEQEKREY